MSVRRRIVIAAGAASVAVVAGLLTGPFSATAAAGPTNLPTSQYTLTANYHQFDAVNSALVSKLGTAPVHTVMDNANHDRTALPSSFSVPGLADGFRFDSADNSDCTNYPQGITTSRDAVGTANSGNYDGHQLVLVSWYTKDGCDGDQERSRITLVDWDATYPNKYRKVLLVEPTGTATTPELQGHPDPRGRRLLVRRLPLRRRHRARHAGVRHAQDPQDQHRRHRRPDRPPVRRRLLRAQLRLRPAADRHGHLEHHLGHEPGVVDDLARPRQQVDGDDRVHLPVRLRQLPQPRAAGDPLPVRRGRRRSPPRPRRARRCSCPGTSSTASPRTTAAGGSTPRARRSSTTGPPPPVRRPTRGSAAARASPTGRTRRTPICCGPCRKAPATATSSR